MSRSRPIVAGNWKMNHGPDETRAFMKSLPTDLSKGGARVLIFPPSLSLSAAAESKPDFVELGVQNLHWETSGAFTGEISASMALAAGASMALVGHSERRHLFNESDDEVGAKTKSAIEAGLGVVVCVGETLTERRAGLLREVLLRQVDAVLGVFQDHPDADALLAYEPVWAIGTGETATPEDASEAHDLLRQRMTEVLGPEAAGSTPILYGGSVKPGNAEALMGAPQVDGVLVGGASLDPAIFAAIVQAVS